MAQKREFRKPRVEEKDEFDKKMLDVRRVTKVVKGGRTMRFSALVVVGDKKGRVGMGIAKASEVPAAIEKATKAAKKSSYPCSNHRRNNSTRNYWKVC